MKLGGNRPPGDNPLFLGDSLVRNSIWHGISVIQPSPSFLFFFFFFFFLSFFLSFFVLSLSFLSSFHFYFLSYRNLKWHDQFVQKCFDLFLALCDFRPFALAQWCQFVHQFVHQFVQLTLELNTIGQNGTQIHSRLG